MTAPQKSTLDRALSKLGIASRTETRALIEGGRVKVNGEVVRDPTRWVDLEQDGFEVDGHRLARPRPIYMMLHKPRGVMTTARDEKGRKTVYDLLPKGRVRVFPVGRLDRETSGLLLLTNDTGFGDMITNPKSKLPKTYLVKVRGVPREDALVRLREGIVLDDGRRTRPATVSSRRLSEKSTWFEVTLVEGMNRQVRRMFEAVGHEVVRLIRVGIGALELGTLPLGAFRELSAEEIVGLRKLAGASDGLTTGEPFPRSKRAKPRRLE